mmetsp:Transcript_81012/g.161563  ORF Transcript_81012/g.161563 Transcript_81012/m.161563 type:complete len:360 (-) Transcript_81012:208-1287(-)
MGLCASRLTPEERDALTSSSKIENLNAQDFQKEAEKIKLLLLGAGESGKSTLFKQMRILYGKGFDEAERVRFLPKIGFNMMEGLQVLCQAVIDLELEALLAAESKPLWEQLLQEPVVFQAPDKGMADFVKVLWRDPAIMSAWEQRSTLQVNESFGTFVERVDVLATQDYVPTEEEVLLCRIRTTGITSQEYEVDGATFSMYDVGGQKNERKKWIHCFDNVNAVMFVAALSEYDQTLFEDEAENRMSDAIQLFKWVCSQSCFESTSMLLFLNKRDLFEKKCPKVDIGAQPAFADYSGAPFDVDDGIKYFSDKFQAQNNNQSKQIFSHVTCATDSSTMKFVFDACREIILQENLRDHGFTY